AIYPGRPDRPAASRRSNRVRAPDPFVTTQARQIQAGRLATHPIDRANWRPADEGSNPTDHRSWELPCCPLPPSARATRDAAHRRDTMAIETMEDLLVHELRDLLNAERQLVKALPKMANAAVSPELAEAFQDHLA